MSRVKRRCPLGPLTTVDPPLTMLLSALLRAVARRQALFLRIFPGRVLHQRVEDGQVRLVEIGDYLPGLAIPLMNTSLIGALVILAGELHRLQHAFEAEFLETVGAQNEIF